MANTRRKNATAHPGYVDLPTPKRPSAEVAKEKAQKEQAKEAAVQKKAASVRKVAELEKKMEEEDVREQSTHVTKGSAEKAPVKKGKGRAAKVRVLSRLYTVRNLDADPAKTCQVVNVGKGGANKRKKAITAESDGSDTERDNGALQSHQLSQSEGPEVNGDSDLTELEDTPRPPKKRAKQDKPSLREIIGTAKTNLAEPPIRTLALTNKSMLPGRSDGAARSAHASADPRTNVYARADDSMQVDDEAHDATQVLGDWLGDRRSGGSGKLQASGVSTRTSTSTEQSASVAPLRTKATPATPFAKPGNPSSKPTTKTKPQPLPKVVKKKGNSQAASAPSGLDVAGDHANDADANDADDDDANDDDANDDDTNDGMKLDQLGSKPKPKPARKAAGRVKGPILELSDDDEDNDNDERDRLKPEPKSKPKPAAKRVVKSQAASVQTAAVKAKGLAVVEDDTNDADDDADAADDGTKRNQLESKPKPKPKPKPKRAGKAAGKVKGPILELSDDDEDNDNDEHDRLKPEPKSKPKPAAKRVVKSQAASVQVAVVKSKGLSVTDDDANNAERDETKSNPKSKPKKMTSQPAAAKAKGLAVADSDDDAYDAYDDDAYDDDDDDDDDNDNDDNADDDDRTKRNQPELKPKPKPKPARQASGKVKGPVLELSDDNGSDNNGAVDDDKGHNKPKPRPAAKKNTKHQVAATSKARDLAVTGDEDETRRDKPKPKPKPKPRKKATSSQAVNKVVDQGLVVSGNEDEERNAAMSSPVKAGARLTSSNLVVVEDLDVTTPNPVRVKVKMESLDDQKALLADREGLKSGANVEKKGSKAGRIKTGTAVKTLPRTHSASASSKSQASRTSEDADSEIEILDHPPAVAGKRKWTTGDLPPGAQNDDRWNSQFVPTLYEYQGSRHDPWTFGDASSVDVVQTIWDKVYGDSLPHKVVSNDNVHGLAIQKIYDWRSGIASGAIGVFERCFNASEKTKYSADRAHKKAAIEAARSAFCNKIHRAWGFVYKEPMEKTYPGHRRKGLFHSPFILPLLMQHMQQTKNSLHISELYRPDDKEYPTSPGRPIGAIGLIAAAVERVVCLWMTSEIVLRHDGRPYRPKKRNTSTGKDSCTKTDFSASNFLSQTTHFKKSAHRLSSGHMMRLLSAAVNHVSLPSPPISQLAHGEPSLGRDELIEGDDSDVSISILASQGQPRDTYNYYGGHSIMMQAMANADSDNDSDSGSENNANDNIVNSGGNSDANAGDGDEADDVGEADDASEPDDGAEEGDICEVDDIAESDGHDTNDSRSDDNDMDGLEQEGNDGQQTDEDDNMLESGDDHND
ncbi:hypothetical protein ONZ51_g6528 [Trametes cubensis]|uniref:Uncharacterized protein n=1 Tax=Trametes cubensis TaxID=1111947 RepID=A0AAD7TRW8_9APHY|nr:hypothetical protein ONZ51_g6528 [Trametes cubensis]